jgi:hypothetical protein
VPERFPNIQVDNADQEEEARAKGYCLPGETRPPYQRLEYPKWVGGALVNNEDEERAVRAAVQTPHSAVASADGVPDKRASPAQLVLRDAIGAAIASRIAGIEPAPDWLISIVGHAVFWIRANHQTREEFPGRRNLRQRLNVLRNAAEKLTGEFKDWHQDLEKQVMISLLEHGGLDRATINLLAQALPRLVAAAAATPPPDSGQGRHKSFSNAAAMSPQEMCAGLVVYGWKRARGELPPHTNVQLHRACEAVWDAAGLPPRDRGGGGSGNEGDSLTGWSQHIQTIKRWADMPHEADKSFRTFWDGLDSVGGG